MKKITIILCLHLLFISAGIAQIPRFAIGPKIGYNTTELTTDASTISSEIKGNFQFGAFLRLGHKVYFQPELNYVTKGGILNGFNSDDHEISQEVTLKTLTLPILLGVKIINLKVASVHLVAGPVASFAIDKKISIKDPDNAWPVKSSEDFKSASWAVQAGAGIDVLIFTFDLRYEAGLGNLYNGLKDNITFRNNLFNVSLGIKLF